MSNLYLLRVLFAPVCCLLFVAAAQAQPTTGGPTPGTSPTAVPLDGGASLLLAGGIGYAVRKLRQRRQR